MPTYTQGQLATIAYGKKRGFKVFEQEQAGSSLYKDANGKRYGLWCSVQCDMPEPFADEVLVTVFAGEYGDEVEKTAQFESIQDAAAWIDDQIESDRHKLRQAKRTAIAGMEADAYSDFKDSYYKAAEGLTTLRELLGEAESSVLKGTFSDDLAAIVAAEKAFDKCDLGAIL